MGGKSRAQEYPYQYKNISVANAGDCGFGATFNFNLPQNFLAIKNLWSYLVIQFAAGEPTANQKINGIGQVTFASTSAGRAVKMKAVNLTADSNRKIYWGIDLTDIIPTLNINAPTTSQQGFFGVSINHPNQLSSSATILLWQLEMVYTTQGIR